MTYRVMKRDDDQEEEVRQEGHDGRRKAPERVEDVADDRLGDPARPGEEAQHVEQPGVDQQGRREDPEPPCQRDEEPHDPVGVQDLERLDPHGTDPRLPQRPEPGIEPGEQVSIPEQDNEKHGGRHDRVDGAEQEAPEAERHVVRLDRRADRFDMPLRKGLARHPFRGGVPVEHPEQDRPLRDDQGGHVVFDTLIESGRNARFFSSFPRLRRYSGPAPPASPTGQSPGWGRGSSLPGRPERGDLGRDGGGRRLRGCLRCGGGRRGNRGSFLRRGRGRRGGNQSEQQRDDEGLTPRHRFTSMPPAGPFPIGIGSLANSTPNRERVASNRNAS